MKTYLLLFILLSSKLCYSQIVTNNTRPAFTLKLLIDDTEFYEAHMNETSFVPKDGVLQLFPGEKIFLEVNITNDSLANFKVVPQNINKERTLTLTFDQKCQNKKHEQMMLSVFNPFSKVLEYKVQINLMKQKKWVKTSIAPVMPGLVSYEMWPDIITSIVLYDFHLKNK